MASNPSQVSEGVAILVAGRTAPIRKGPQAAADSLPVVLPSDQDPIPVREVDKSITEVSLSMLGVPRSERSLGIFSDVTTYDVNPNEWKAARSDAIGVETVIAGTANDSAFTHVPVESAGYIESNASGMGSSFYALLSSKRFFRYQPGRASSGTFGTRTTVSADWGDIKKIGCFDLFNGYYFEIQGGLQVGADKDFNFLCVKRSNAFLSPAGLNPSGVGDSGIAGTNAIIVRDGHAWIHAGVHDRRLRVGSGGSVISTPGGNFQVNPLYRYVYEYRVPRKFFSHDPMNGLDSHAVYYSDKVPSAQSFGVSINGANIDASAASPITYANGSPVDGLIRSSVWDLDFTKVVMLKIDFSWYGAVGATFLAYVPDRNTPGESRWVRIHNLRASNQHTLPSLGNPFLPISYLVQRGSQAASRIYKYGASFYIDGGDEGTLVPRSIANAADIEDIPTAAGYGVVMAAIRVRTAVNGIRNRMQVYPTRLSVGCSARAVITLVKGGTPSAAIAYTPAATLSPVEAAVAPAETIVDGTGIPVATFQVGAGGTELDLSPYFAYNKDYLSFPLADAVGDVLAVCVRAASGTVDAAIALTWNEQQ